MRPNFMSVGGYDGMRPCTCARSRKRTANSTISSSTSSKTSGFARRAHATLAARRTRSVNREAARCDGAPLHARPTVSRTAPDLPAQRKERAIMTTPRQKPPKLRDGEKGKKRAFPLARATGTESEQELRRVGVRRQPHQRVLVGQRYANRPVRLEPYRLSLGERDAATSQRTMSRSADGEFQFSNKAVPEGVPCLLRDLSCCLF
jgi:hypothetical protein